MRLLCVNYNYAKLNISKLRYCVHVLAHTDHACAKGISETINSNSNLYERCECREISTDVMDMRWRLFGHVLHLDEKAPVNQAMSAYFNGGAADPEPASPGRLTPTRSRSSCP